MKNFFRFLSFCVALCCFPGSMRAQGLLISEVLANPNGNDLALEYVELIATQTINFSATPYSVVFSNNGNATAAGWIAGGTITYGFNINTGIVNAGDVVYVGGSSMSPTGTKLRVINVTNTPGDGFGSAVATAGVLGNGGANADAVGVFNVGITAITNSTVPVDAIFFGTGPTPGSSVVSGGAAGYQLPVNDSYNGGKLQSNSFLAGDPGADEIIKATGVFNTTTNTFSTSRTWSKTTTPSPASSITLVGAGIVLTPASLSFNTGVGTPSASQSYLLKGSSLSSDVLLTAPVPFELSLSAAVGFNSTLTVTAAAANAGVTVYARYNPAVAGPNSGTVAHVSGSITQSLALQGSTSTVASISATPASLNFSTVVGTPSAIQSYSLQGAGLLTDVSVTAPAQFEIASAIVGPFTSSATVTAAAANAGAVIYVRYNPSAAATHSGTITNVSDATANVQVNGTSDATVPVYSIQGSGTASAYINTTVVTQGIVTGDFQNSNQLKGFYIQAFPGDGNPQTSDGIFIYDNAFGVNVNVGDLVSVKGQVTEFNTATEINNVSAVTVISSGNAFSPTTVSLPIPAGTDLEKYEGMYVKFEQTLTVSETYTLGRYGELLLSADGRRFNPTNFIDPNDNTPAGNNSSGTSNVAAVLAQQDLNNRRSILLDDGSTIQNPAVVPYLNPADTTLRIGTTVTNLTGVLDFAFDKYRLQPTAAPSFTYAPRPALPSVGTPNVKLASFNVLNFFNGDGLGGGFPTSRGADTYAEFLRQRAKIVLALKQLNADAVGLMEVENDGDGPNSAIADLVNALNAATAPGTYAYITDPTAGNGALGTDEIKVAIIYKPATLTPFGPSRIDTSSAYTVIGYSRRPLTQAFTLANGEKFSFIVNHQKSKGCNAASLPADADQNDGQGCFNDSRKKQAAELLQFIQRIKTLTGDSDVVALGDINAYEEEDPIDLLKAGGLINLITNNYSYVFDGQSGSLDHVFVTPSLAAKVTGAAKWHINADEPIIKDYNQEFNPAYTYRADAYRSSDHDPILIGLTLNIPLSIAHAALADSRENGPFAATATISGGPLYSAKLVYSVNGVVKPDISPVASGNSYTFTIPAQPGSGTIQYRIVAYGADTAFFPSASGYHSFHFGNVKSSNYVLKTTPLIGSYLNTKIYLGGASGLQYIKGSNNEFFTITDRGPNLDANNNRNVIGNPNADNAKLFALPSFVPEILRLRISGDSLELVSRLPLKRPDGTTASGLINPPGFGNSGELALVDTAGTRATPDIWGIDSEGITDGNNNDFWISEEYGTSIWNVSKTDGKVIKRYAPYGNLPGKQPQDEPLDTVFKYRNPNKGLEGIAFTPDGKVYGFIQNTLLFPASDASLKKNTRLHRFVQLDPVTGISTTFGYEHDAVPASGNGSSIKNDKIYIGDAVAINNQEFLILEHGKSATESIGKVYKITLTGATPITQAFYPSAGNKSFEQFLNAATAQANGVTCVTKTLFLDLIENGYDPTIEKKEGLTIINDSTIAVINDNDFGIISPNTDGNVVATGVKTVISTFTVPQNLRLNTCKPAVLTATGATTINAGDSTALSVNAPVGSTVTWKKDGVIIPGITSATLYAKLAGNYTATVNTAVCTSESNSISIIVNVNIAPTVAITAPVNGTVYLAGDFVTILATAKDTDGTVAKVEFFVNAVKVGEDATSPYQFKWNSIKGSASLTAVATDNKGLKTTSVAVNIEVTPNVNIGPSAIQSPYIKPSIPNASFTSILSATDVVGGYKMCGTPDGLGAFDNGNGTFTLLMNHEFGNTAGIARAHGSAGAFVSKWVINKSDLAVVSGSDLIRTVKLWNGSGYTTYNPGTSSPLTAFNRFCSADLPAVSAFYNSATGLGTQERIFMNGEESGNEGRAFGHIATGPNAGTTYELPYLGKFSWENSVASPTASDKTVVAGMDDATPGQVYFYIGTKTNTGTEIDKAGLSNGKLYGVAVSGLVTESSSSIPAADTPFTLANLGSVQNTTGAALNTASNTAGVTTFLRPEDGAWDPSNLNDFYFATTNALNSPSRLWKLHFTNPANPELGGTITAVLDGSEGQKMLDNLTIDNYGHILLVEDVGGDARLGKVWQYTIATDALVQVGEHDAARFLSGGANFLTQDEEASGILDVQAILGKGKFLTVTQAHYSIPGEVVEGGQLLAYYNPDTFNSNEPPTVKITAPAAGSVYVAGDVVTITATAKDTDGTVAKVEFFVNGTKVGESLTAPYQFSWTSVTGTANLTAIATDNKGATATSALVTITVKDNIAPVIAITAPASGTSYFTGDVVAIAATASDSDGTVAKVEFFANGAKIGEDVTLPYELSWTSLAGAIELTAVATDNKGKQTTSAIVTIIVKDNIAPTVVITSPTPGATYIIGDVVAIQATAADADGTVAKVEFFINGAKIGEDIIAPYQFDWTLTGTASITAVATDNKGKQTTSAAVAISVNQSPTVSVTAPVNGTTFITGDVVNITAAAADADGTVSKVEFFVNGTKVGEDATAPYEFSWTSLIADTASITAVATDNKGAQSTSAVVTITVKDNLAPTVSITAPTNGAIVITGDVVNINATAADADGTVSKVEFFVNGTKVGEDAIAPYQFSWASVTGTANLTAVATDNRGKQSTAAVVNITVKDNLAPTVSITSPANGAIFTPGSIVAIAAAASDADGTIAKVEFFVNGVKIGEDLTAPYQYNWTLGNATASIIAVATDNRGKQSTSAAVVISGPPANKIPVAKITAPANGATYTTGAVVAITATASDSDGTVTKVEFYVNGVKKGEDATAPYQYNWTSVAGTANLTAVATDNKGAKGTSPVVTITISNYNCANANLAVNAGPDKTVKRGYPPLECATLPSIITGGTSPYSILWSTGATSANITVCPQNSTTYSVMVKDAKGCTATDNVNICVEKVKCAADAVYICWTYKYNQNIIAKLTFCTSPAVAQLLVTYFNTSTTTWSIGQCFNPGCSIAFSGDEGGDFGSDTYLTAEEYTLIYGAPVVKLYPNPLTDLSTVNLELKNVVGETVQVTVRDIVGRTILNKKLDVNDHAVNAQLNFGTELAKGTYVVRIATGSTVVTEKLVVQ